MKPKEKIDFAYLINKDEKKEYMAIFFKNGFTNDTLSFFINDQLIFEDQILNSKTPRHGDSLHGYDFCFLLKRTDRKIKALHDGADSSSKNILRRQIRLKDDAKFLVRCNGQQFIFLINVKKNRMISFRRDTGQLDVIIHEKLFLFM